MEREEIVERIGYFRTKAGKSQKALSIDIDMNIGYINRLESKKDFLPSMETLIRIINACGITMEEFFYCDYMNYGVDKRLLKGIKNLPKEKKNLLMQLFDWQ